MAGVREDRLSPEKLSFEAERSLPHLEPVSPFSHEDTDRVPQAVRNSSQRSGW